MFAGHSEYDQVCRIYEVLGCPPAALLQAGSRSQKFFCRSEFFEEIKDGLEDFKGECASLGLMQGQADSPEKLVDSRDVQIVPPVFSVDCALPMMPPSDFVRSVLKQQESGEEADAKCANSFSGSTTAETDDSDGLDEQPKPREEPKPKRKRLRLIVRWSLKTRKAYEKDELKKEPPQKKYSRIESIGDMIGKVPLKGKLSQEEKERESSHRTKFEQMLAGMLCMNPDKRWTPKQALEHTFVTGEPHDPMWTPPFDTKVASFATALPPKAACTERVAKGPKVSTVAQTPPEAKAEAKTSGEVTTPVVPSVPAAPKAVEAPGFSTGS